MSTERPYAPRENPDEAEVEAVSLDDLGEDELNFDLQFARDSLYEREDDFASDDEGYFDDGDLL